MIEVYKIIDAFKNILENKAQVTYDVKMIIYKYEKIHSESITLKTGISSISILFEFILSKYNVINSEIF